MLRVVWPRSAREIDLGVPEAAYRDRADALSRV
jgi:hypothetical protein